MHMHVRLCTHDVRTQIVTPSASTYPPTTHQLEEAATEVARFRSESMRCQAEINISILFTFNWNNSSIKSDLPLPTYCLPTVYLPTYSRTYQAENDALRSELKAAQARHVRHAAYLCASSTGALVSTLGGASARPACWGEGEGAGEGEGEGVG